MASAFRRFLRPFQQGLLSKERVGAGTPVTPSTTWDLNGGGGSWELNGGGGDWELNT